MNKRHIHRIRRHFILISTLSLFCVMIFLSGIIYFFNRIAMINELKQIMNVIVENDGVMPGQEKDINSEIYKKDDDKDFILDNKTDMSDMEVQFGMEWDLMHLFGKGSLIKYSSDYLRSTVYFSVLFDEEENVDKIIGSHVSELNEDNAAEYAKYALNSSSKFGHIGRYYYCVKDRKDSGTIVIYVDRTSEISTSNRILFYAIILIATGTLLSFLLMFIISIRIVKVETENSEKQKQFITNASHELKTPLAVIRANTEMEEIVKGKTEWTSSTIKQITRMSILVENLVKIARADEQNNISLSEIDISLVCNETIDSFMSVARSENKEIISQIESNIIFTSEESLLRQLLTLLLDNGVKYCDDHGKIKCFLKKQGKKVEIIISNTYLKGKNMDYSHFFDRFYREDKSHNTDKGGYGIGLSVVESIVGTLKGEISVYWKDGDIFFRVLLK